MPECWGLEITIPRMCVARLLGYFALASSLVCTTAAQRQCYTAPAGGSTPTHWCEGSSSSSSSSGSTYGSAYHRTVVHADPQHTKCNFWGSCTPIPGYHWVQRNGEWWVERLPQQEFENQRARAMLRDAYKAYQKNDYKGAIDLALQAPAGTSSEDYRLRLLASAWDEWGVQAWDAADYATARQRFENATHYSSDEKYAHNLRIAQARLDARQFSQTVKEVTESVHASLLELARGTVVQHAGVNSSLDFMSDADTTDTHVRNVTSEAIQQALNVDLTGKRANGTFTRTGRSQWDTGSIIVAPAVNVSVPTAHPTIRDVPPALKADPKAWAKYQAIRVHQEQLKEQSAKLERDLAVVRAQQARAEGDLPELAVQGAKIKDQLTANASAIQTDAVHMEDLSVSFEETKIPASRATSQQNAKSPK